ncbi:hypothetical protein BH10PSE17_BH10PSE17_03220 [soil metagenome]
MHTFLGLKKTTAALLIALSACPWASADDVTHPVLRDKLLQMKALDQAPRMAGKTSLETADSDAANRAELKAIIKEFGWPTLPMVGSSASQGAWLIVQHADDEPLWQADVLETLEHLSRQQLVPPEQVAYLYDRLHRPQRFGTQGACVAKLRWQPREIEWPESVDQRRKAANLDPLETYVEFASKVLCARFE